MYGDDERSSWPNNDSPLLGAADLMYRGVDRASRASSTYYSATANSHHSSHSGAAHRASAGSRPSSADTSSPYIGIEEDASAAVHNILPPIPHGKPSQGYSGGGLSSNVVSVDHSLEVASPQSSRYLSPSPPMSRPSSSRPSSTRSHTSSAPSGHTSAIQRSSRGPPSERASVATHPSHIISRPPSQTTATSTSPRLVSRKRSDFSITPSAGEDPDSFHVRSTYAQLDILGVKGDGIEDGVERTRARVGNSPEGELKAAGASGDEYERRRDLTPAELQMLASLDRCVACSHALMTYLTLGPQIWVLLRSLP
jgi:USP6 N-terminal-like protein